MGEEGEKRGERGNGKGGLEKTVKKRGTYIVKTVKDKQVNR